MAKLSAYGSEELLRATKGREADGDRPAAKTVVSYRSDGRVLSCQVVEFESGRHSYGWRLVKRYPKAEIAVRVAEVRAEIVAGRKPGWVIS